MLITKIIIITIIIIIITITKKYISFIREVFRAWPNIHDEAKNISKYKFMSFFFQATSKTWTRTLNPGPEPWTLTLKNLDPEEPGP